MKIPASLCRPFAAVALFATAGCPVFGSTIILDEFTRTSPGKT
jgi:hypothetical protein